MVKAKFDAVVTSRLLRWSMGLAVSLCFNINGVSAGGIRTATVTLRLDPYVILQQVAQQMNVTLRPDVPLPKIFLESNTPLRQFQRAIAPQWKFRPHVFANAYAAERNEIYLSDDARYYKKRNRTLDDSLAHEFVHYIQCATATMILQMTRARWRRSHSSCLSSTAMRRRLLPA